MTLILDREGEREHPAVAVPQQVDPPESQGLPDALDFLDDSLDRESKEGGDATERLELLAGLVVTTHEDDGPTGRLGRAHELLDPGVAHDGIAHEEGLDRAGIGRLLHLRRTVGHRAVCGDRLEEFFDELRLVSDAAFAEHLGADARPEGLLDPLHPRMRGAVDVDLRRQGRIAGLQVLDEGLPREAGPDEDQRLPDLRGPQLDEDVVEEGGPRVSGGEHLAVPRRPDGRQLTDSILPQLGDQGLLVVEAQTRSLGRRRLWRCHRSSGFSTRTLISPVFGSRWRTRIRVWRWGPFLLAVSCEGQRSRWANLAGISLSLLSRGRIEPEVRISCIYTKEDLHGPENHHGPGAQGEAKVARVRLHRHMGRGQQGSPDHGTRLSIRL